MHSVVAFFSFTINEREEYVDSLILAFLTPSQAASCCEHFIITLQTSTLHALFFTSKSKTPKKKTRVQVQGETYESESLKYGLKSYPTLRVTITLQNFTTKKKLKTTFKPNVTGKNCPQIHNQRKKCSLETGPYLEKYFGEGGLI